ncbi:putative late blight resistance protein homolog R1B-12 [Nicotiana tomentosiformis]|uniref:putative late blight resistance protein homolog R1B-12 n=1 Tax=Nicotiana tomentosiformis TaxID=4098 RepID=UPI00051AB3F3|nr:putative late blight resistance protein homolog R1B-12 [Nicotiana tomentosiformis]XP_033514639.1 putative late blight resistance protein homolog R1B-12 [Nicotiana tomentosiformis]
MENVEKTAAHAKPSTEGSFLSNNEDFVGFEEDVNQIIQKLTGFGGPKQRDIISIVGMPGLGKTTLAKKVYDNPLIIHHFNVRAFCTVSQKYDERKLLVEILKQVTGDKLDINEDVDVADAVKKALFGWRYLIVLDDIWNYNAWEDLQLCFPSEEKGSRIMITTRDEKVAKEIKQHSDPYLLRFLTKEESWELLQKKVFQCESCPPELCEAGEEVAKNCKGLPLVIVLTAPIIAQKERQASVWLEFAKVLSSHGLEELSTKAIRSSYDNLRVHLKHCLLYMGYFPEDFKIEVSDLLKLWIAEELVQNIDTKNLEKASKDCLNDLVNRSLLIVSKRRSNGDIKYCMVHDLVRAFCSSKLEEENFKQQIAPYNLSQTPSSQDPHLCMYIHDELVEQLELNGYLLDLIPMVYSEERESIEFIAHPQFYASNRVDLFPVIISLRLIRVLHLLDVNLENDRDFQVSPASTLGLLFHLRYLAIFVKKFDFNWVSHLSDLQTLRVHSHQRIKTSPDIWKMTKLRHVDISEFSFIWEHNEHEESSQTVLENLKSFGKCRVSVADMNRKFWWRFPNLEELKLSIVNLHDMPNHSLFSTAETHNQLQSLDISFPIGFSKSIGWFKSVFPLNLKVLSLAGISLTEAIVSSIIALENLETLKLFFIHFTCDPLLDVTSKVFKALKYLKLEQVDMIQWHSSDTSFPVLEKLVIKDCGRLEKIPSSFAEILSLKSIKVINCSDSVENSAWDIKKEAEDTEGSDRIQVHIPKKN